VNDDAGSHPNDDSNSSFQLQQFMDEHNEKLNALKDEINEQNAKHEHAMQAVQREYDSEIRRLNKVINDEKNVSETDAIEKLTSKYQHELESAHEEIKVLEEKVNVIEQERDALFVENETLKEEVLQNQKQNAEIVKVEEIEETKENEEDKYIKEMELKDAEINALEQKVNECNRKITMMKTQNNKKLNALRNEMDAQIAEHKDRMKEFQSRYDSEIGRLKRIVVDERDEYEKKLIVLGDANDKLRYQLSEKNADAKAMTNQLKILNAANTKIAELKQKNLDFEKERKALLAKHTLSNKQMREQFIKEQEKLLTKHDAESTRRQSEYDAVKSKLKKRMKEIERLKSQNNELNMVVTAPPSTGYCYSFFSSKK